MAKSNTKHKQVVNKSIKHKNQQLLRKKQVNKTEQESDKLTQSWAQEIEALQSKQYSTVEAACEGLIDLVVERIKSSKELQSQTREFLKTVLQTDPDILQELKGALQIKDD